MKRKKNARRHVITHTEARESTNIYAQFPHCCFQHCPPFHVLTLVLDIYFRRGLVHVREILLLYHGRHTYIFRRQKVHPLGVGGAPEVRLQMEEFRKQLEQLELVNRSRELGVGNLSPTRSKLSSRLAASAARVIPRDGHCAVATKTLVEGLELLQRAGIAGVQHLTPVRSDLQARVGMALRIPDRDSSDDYDGCTPRRRRGGFEREEEGGGTSPPCLRRTASLAGWADEGTDHAGEWPGWADGDDGDDCAVAAAVDAGGGATKRHAPLVASTRTTPVSAVEGTASADDPSSAAAPRAAPVASAPFATVRRVDDATATATSERNKKARPDLVGKQLTQRTLGAFAEISTKHIKHKNIVTHVVTAPHSLETTTAPKGVKLVCQKGCGMEFAPHAHGARGVHEKKCNGAAKPDKKPKKRTIDSAADGDGEKESGTPDKETASSGGGAAGSAASSAAPKKMTKSGEVKQARGADHRKRYNLVYRLTVIDAVRELENVGCSRAQLTVAERFKIHPSTVSKFCGSEATCRETLTTNHHANGKYRGAIMLANSKIGRRVCLGGGRSALFPLAEHATFTEFRSMRSRGLRVSPRMARALMIKYIKEHYDDSARETFKASSRWLAAFSFRCGLSYRRKSNKKPISAAERVPKLQRWHARLRRRLQRGEFKKDEYKPAALNKRGEKVDIIVSAQSSHRETPGGTAWDLDCGLCAVKNAASDSTLTLPGLLAVVRPLEEERQKSQEARGAHFLEEGEGNFSGQGLIAFLEQNDYECITGRGHLWELVEMLCCTDIGARFLGVVYHLPGESASCAASAA